MDKFGFLSEYLQDQYDSLGDYDCGEVVNNSDDCPELFYSQQSTSGNFHHSQVQDEIDFDGLIDSKESEVVEVGELFIFNQHLTECNGTDDHSLQVYKLVVEDISDDENAKECDLR